MVEGPAGLTEDYFYVAEGPRSTQVTGVEACLRLTRESTCSRKIVSSMSLDMINRLSGDGRSADPPLPTHRAAQSITRCLRRRRPRRKVDTADVKAAMSALPPMAILVVRLISGCRLTGGALLDSVPTNAILELRRGAAPALLQSEGDRIASYRSAGFRASELTQSDLLVVTEGDSDAGLLTAIEPSFARAALRAAGGRSRVVQLVTELSHFDIPIVASLTATCSPMT